MTFSFDQAVIIAISQEVKPLNRAFLVAINALILESSRAAAQLHLL